MRRRLMAAVWLAAGAASVSMAHASEFVLFDGTYTHEDKGSHRTIKIARGVPADWRSPVDYSTGRAYFRLEVIKKPNDTTASTYQICMSIGSSMSTCSAQGLFRTTGVVTWSQDLQRWYRRGNYDFSRPPDHMRAVVRDTKNKGIDPGVAFEGAPDTGLYLPLHVRFTIWVVTKGARLDPARPLAPVQDGGTGGDGGPTGDAGVAAETDLTRDVDGGPSSDARKQPTSLDPDEDVGEEERPAPLVGGCRLDRGGGTATGAAVAVVLVLAISLGGRRQGPRT